MPTLPPTKASQVKLTRNDPVTDFEKLKNDDGNTLRAGMTPLRAAVLGLVGSFFLYQVFGSILALLIFGLNLENVDLTAFRLLQIASQILFLLLPAIVFSKVIYSNVTRVLRFYLPEWAEIGLFSLGIFILFPLITGLVTIQQAWVDALFNNYSFLAPLKNLFDTLNSMIEQAYSQLLKVRSPLDAMLVFAVVAITPAVCEEMIFRGYIQTSFSIRYNQQKAAWITALFFAVYHFNPTGFFGLFLLGWYFGFAAYKTNSIFVPMLLHFIYNGSAALLYFLGGEAAAKEAGPVTPELLRASYLTVGALVFAFAGFLYIIHRFYAAQLSAQSQEAEGQI